MGLVARVGGVCVWAAVVFGCATAGPRPVAATFEQEAVAADHEVASRAGAEVLKQGGNAVDAAVAASFALSVVRPYSCGIGGGGFMVIRFSEAGARAAARAGREVSAREVAINYREMAPGVVEPDFFERLPAGASERGGTAVAVPGTVAGLLRALERYGTLDRETVLAPAIRAAEEGFIVDEHYARRARELAARFEREPEWQERYRFVWERFLRRGEVAVGDRIRLPEQAAALRLIARDGAAAFYEGPIGEAVVRAVREAGGVMTMEDLGAFRVSESAPLRFEFKGWTFITMPPPSSGGVAMAEALRIFERVMPEPPRPVRVGSNVAQVREAVSWANRESREVRAYRAGPLYLHTLAESLKHAFADRSRWLGDPAQVDVPVARLTSVEYAAERAATIRLGAVLEQGAYGTPESGAGLMEDGGTSHFSVVDRWGSAVACTETINLEFGSLVAVPEFGFVLNNEMDDFTTRAGEPNAFGLVQSARNLPSPGKRPLSSMTPTVVVDQAGRVEAVAGGSGGPRIITATVQVLLNALVFGDGAGEAVSRPRMHHQWEPNVLRLEPGLFEGEWSALGPWAPGGPAGLREALVQFGHRVERRETVGEVQLIVRDEEGKWQAASDPRKGGRPAGR